jgi:chromosome segregation ATPase
VRPDEHPLLAVASELERRDAELAAQIDDLTQLEAEIAELRAVAERVAQFRAELPSLHERAEDEVRRALREIAVRHTAVCAAKTAVATAKDRTAEERALATAETAYGDAKSRLERVREEKEKIDRRAVAAETEATQALELARKLASRVGGEVADDIEQWAARARAAVFAERTHAEAERQRIQQEASELAAAVTGEAIVGDVPRVRRAVEAGLRA